MSVGAEPVGPPWTSRRQHRPPRAEGKCARRIVTAAEHINGNIKRQRKETDSLVRTEDFGFVAAAMLHGVPPERTIRENSRLVFLYQPSQRLDELKSTWEDDSLLVRASSHAALIKGLASRARDAR